MVCVNDTMEHQVSEVGRPGIAQTGVMRLTTDQGYPGVSTISEDELDEMVSEESQAQQPGDDSPPDPTTGIDGQIKKAEQGGEWLRAGQLKIERAKLEGQPSQEPQEESEGESIKNLIAQVHDAEINRDFYASGVAKVKLTNKRAAQNPLNAYGVDVAPTPSSDQDQALEQRIHDAESRGEWGESLRLKSLRAGVTP